MGLFGRSKTLSQAVLAGEIRTVRKLLEDGADPNRCDPNDNACPIHYAVNHGPDMVALLLRYGANPNVSSRGRTPLANAEGRGLMDVAAVLRSAGARLYADDEDPPEVDPRLRVALEGRIGDISFMVMTRFVRADRQEVAEKVEELFFSEFEFPPNLSSKERESLRSEIRKLIGDMHGVELQANVARTELADPIALEYSACFVVPFIEHSTIDLQATLQSIVRFATTIYGEFQQKYKDPGFKILSPRIVPETDPYALPPCIQSAEHTFVVDSPSPLPGLPEIAALMSASLKYASGEVLVIYPVERKLEVQDHHELASAINAIGNDVKLLVISRQRTRDGLPIWAALSCITATTRGVWLSACEGSEIVTRKERLGHSVYRRNTGASHHIKYDVSWLCGHLAFEFQEDRDRAGLHYR